MGVHRCVAHSYFSFLSPGVPESEPCKAWSVHATGVGKVGEYLSVSLTNQLPSAAGHHHQHLYKYRVARAELASDRENHLHLASLTSNRPSTFRRPAHARKNQPPAAS